MDLAGRPDPPFAGDEAATLSGFLDFQRATLTLKTDGLDAAQLRARHAPSAMTLGGLLKHMAYNENFWVAQRLAGEAAGAPWDGVDWDADPDWDWHSAADDDPDQIRALWSAEVTRAQAALDRILQRGDFGQPSSMPMSDGRHVSVRWVIAHLIEEYARHNGHADLIRESIDGATGE
ncbi:DinB family protein [uncultured Jatrophihabitans sp.]|uniref:DinB family protein n=1 Tax=uncultured Jatrophihabitans sp. TaxID=1610747 RepID=UPI0035CA2114